MQHLLTYDDVLQQLNTVIINEEVNYNEAYKTLNQLTIQNGYKEFNYDIAVELFDRIGQPMNVQALAAVIIEAHDIIIAKCDYYLKEQVYIQEQQAYLKQMSQWVGSFQSDTIILIDKIIIQDSKVNKPYLIIHMGENIYETEIQTSSNQTFEWKQKITLPVSQLNTLSIELLENQQIINSISIPCEALPYQDLKEAELKFDGEYESIIHLNCKLQFGTNQNILIQEKLQILNDKLKESQLQFAQTNQQYFEICSPFIKGINVNQQPQLRFKEQQDIFVNLPSHKTAQAVSLQATAFHNTSGWGGFQEISNNQNLIDLRQYSILARLDILCTLIGIISSIINYYSHDLLSFSLLMIIVLSIMLKNKNTLIYLLIMSLISLIIDFCLIFNGTYMFAILLIVLNMILKSILIVLTIFLYKDNGKNLQILKTKLLIL